MTCVSSTGYNLFQQKKRIRRLTLDRRISVLANSANTNCSPFQVKINCFKFITMDVNKSAT